MYKMFTNNTEYFYFSEFFSRYMQEEINSLFIDLLRRHTIYVCAEEIYSAYVCHYKKYIEKIYENQFTYKEGKKASQSSVDETVEMIWNYRHQYGKDSLGIHISPLHLPFKKLYRCYTEYHEDKEETLEFKIRVLGNLIYALEDEIYDRSFYDKKEPFKFLQLIKHNYMLLKDKKYAHSLLPILDKKDVFFLKTYDYKSNSDEDDFLVIVNALQKISSEINNIYLLKKQI